MPNTDPPVHTEMMGDELPGADIASADEIFPPLTISLETFVKNGSDREFREMMFALIALHNQMQLHMDRFARSIGTSNAQFHVVMALAQKPGLTVSQLAELMNVAGPLVTIEIGSLVRKGIIERRANENDRRSSYLNLTARGEDLVRQVSPLLRLANDLHFQSLTGERAVFFRECLHEIVADGRRVVRELESLEVTNAMAASTPPETKETKGV
jgi:MarR family transcriptional regulator, organic hydroperoxide resistance regulator